jgi:hypothetical protein
MRRMRSRKARSIFGRPALLLDFQRQNALKPPRCQRSTVCGFTTWTVSSKSGQSRTIHASNARSKPPSRRRAGARRKATFSWWRSQRFSASSRLRDLNRLAIRTAVACRTADIERQDATILPWHANPAPDGIFGKDTGGGPYIRKGQPLQTESLLRRDCCCATHVLIREENMR